jgi:hypothetical protein
VVTRFIGLLQTVTTINYSAMAKSRTLQFITAHTESSQVCCGLTSRCFVTASNSGDCSSSVLTSLLATYCFIASGHWLSSRVWLPLAIAGWHSLQNRSVGSVSVGLCQESNYWFRVPFFYCCCGNVFTGSSLAKTVSSGSKFLALRGNVTIICQKQLPKWLVQH